MIQDYEPHCEECGMLLSRQSVRCHNCGVSTHAAYREDVQPILDILLYPDREGYYRARVSSSGYSEVVHTGCTDKTNALQELSEQLSRRGSR